MTHGRQLSADEELARPQQLLQQALQQQQSTQQVMMTRQLAHEQGPLSLQKAILQKALVKYEPIPPLEPPPMTSHGGKWSRSNAGDRTEVTFIRQLHTSVWNSRTEGPRSYAR